MITVLGPTAIGKTRLAALIADALNGEIISADSRQVYRKMNIGTGKDYEDYIVNGKTIKVHLVDIVDPGTEYNVFRFVEDFNIAYNSIVNNNKLPVLCGGSGLYIEAVIKDYYLPEVPINYELRKKLENKSQEELVQILKSLKKNHNTTDFTDKNRTIKAIEIAEYLKSNPDYKNLGKNSLIIGITADRTFIREKISNRLQKRIQQGLIDEVQQLITSGITYEQLYYYGLEYRYIALYLQNKLSYSEMFAKLNIAINQFAKKQMTWFRRMEKNNIKIHWLDAEQNDTDKLSVVKKLYVEWINGK